MKRAMSLALAICMTFTGNSHQVYASVQENAKEDMLAAEQSGEEVTEEEITEEVPEEETPEEEMPEEEVPKEEVPEEETPEEEVPEEETPEEEVPEEETPEEEVPEEEMPEEETPEEEAPEEETPKEEVTEEENGDGSIAEKQNQLSVQDVDGTQKQFECEVTTTDYSDIQIAVWSDADGQDDLVWYIAHKDGDIYKVNVEIKKHASLGRYYAHAYGKDKDGTMTMVSGTTFQVDAPTVGEITAETTENGFRVNISEITSPSGIETVKAAVWGKEDQSDLIWKTILPTDGTYVIEVDANEHKKTMGKYYVHVYAVDGNGIDSFCAGVERKVQAGAGSMKTTVSEEGCDILLSDVTCVFDNRVSIAVWSKKDGQDDLVWYDAKKEGRNYSVSVPLDKLTDAGVYYAHAYMIDSSGESTFLINKTFTIDGIVTIGEPENGELIVDIAKIDTEKSFVDFSADVWTQDDKSDVQTIHSEKQSDGNYTITIPLSPFGLYSGDYHLNIYRNMDDGKSELMKETSKSIIINKGTVAPVAISSNKMIYTVTLNDVDMKGMEKEIRFAVWSEENGQDGLQWYTAEKSGNSYQVKIPMYKYNDTGSYNVHIYADLQDDSSYCIVCTSFQVDEIVKSGVEVKQISGKTGTAQIVETMGDLGYEITGVRVGVWDVDENGEQKGDVVWYDMSGEEDDYTATFDVRNHKYQFGTYNAHVYVVDTNGDYVFLDGTSFTITANNMVVYEKTDSSNGKVLIYGPNVKNQKVDSVRMATWSCDGNQDDLKWITAKKNEEGIYYVEISRSDYKRGGEYATHVYGTVNGEESWIGGIRYIISDAANDEVAVIREFDDQAKEVMHNIIYAVETGGQVYGNAQYDCFVEAYHISEKETAITIGAACWFATEAQKLLKLIREEDPELFASLDTEGISDDIDNMDWTTYGSDGEGNVTIEKGSAKAKCIQALISTDVGIRVQDRLVDEEMTKYINEAKNLDVKDLKGQMFLANVRHLGGSKPMKWVVECCIEDGLPLTMRNLYTSMRNHTENKAGNGVGADKYDTRHKKVMGWIDEYIN